MKITPTAQHRCDQKTMAEQLAIYREKYAKELEQARAMMGHDQADIVAGFEADKSWSGQHARLSKTHLEGAD